MSSASQTVDLGRVVAQRCTCTEVVQASPCEPEKQHPQQAEALGSGQSCEETKVSFPPLLPSQWMSQAWQWGGDV